MEKGNVVRPRAEADLRNMPVRHCQSLRQNSNRARDVILAGDMKIALSPCDLPAKFSDGGVKASNVAVDKAEGFAIFALPGQVGMKTRNSGFLDQFLDAHLGKASDETSGHFRCSFQVDDELIVRYAELQDIVSSLALRLER